MKIALALLVAAAPALADDALIAEAKAAVTRGFKDPYSAVFEGLYMGKAANGKPVVCGTVNAKNSYGAFTGRKRFYYFEGDSHVQDGGTFDVVLRSLCG
jgi:hypothetical protein